MDMEAPAGSEGRNLRCPGCGGVFAWRLPVAEIVETDPDDPRGEVLLSDEISDPEPAASGPTEELEEEEEGEEVEAIEDVLARAAEDKPKRIVEENPRQWYVMVGGVAAVALTFEELQQRAGGGQVKPKTRIFYARKGVTVRARDIPGLFPDEGARRAEKAEKEGKAGKSRRPRAAKAPADPEADDIADALRRLGEADG